MAVKIQFRRDIAADWTSNNPILSEGEFGLELDTNQFKIGNGTDAWNDLGYGGIQGPPGEIIPTGEYDNSTPYSIGDAVSYFGSSYVAIAATTGNIPTDETYWQLLSQGYVSYETISKNLKQYPATLNYTGNRIDSIVYTTETGTITKTFSYSGLTLLSITLSGDTPAGIDLVKTFNYTLDKVSSYSYS